MISVNTAIVRRRIVAASIGGVILGLLSSMAGGTEPQRTAVDVPDFSGMTCQVHAHAERPVMFINGEPRFPMAFMSYYPEPFRYRQMADHGIHVYSLSLTLTDKWLARARKRVVNDRGLWKGPDEIDFPSVERALREIIEADPKALIFPRIYCDSPFWWDKLHPDQIRPIRDGCPLRQSFSSLCWRNETADALRKIVRFVSSSPCGRHVIGYMLCAGETEEFGDQPDFTSCAQQRFRAWIWERYKKNADEVGRLFGMGIDAVAIPSEAEQQLANCGNFLDPLKSRLVIDYRQFHSDEAVDSALTLCKAVKDEAGGRLITGVFYGYTRIWPDWGHLALRRLLASDAVDFISNPYSSGGPQSNLWVGNRDFHTFTEIDSIRKAGKLFYAEDDIRTSLSRYISQLKPEIDPNGEYNTENWLGPPTIPESLEILKTVFAKALTNGSANWWFDLWGGWYDDERILQLFGRMQTIGDESLQRSCKSVAQVAVVLDENSYRYLPNGVSQFGGRFAWVEAQLEQLGKIGAPYDFYLLDDLKDLDLSPYRMVVFLNAFALSQDQRRMIADRCAANDRWLVWLYAPGLIQENLSVDNMTSLLGMRFQMAPTQPKSLIPLRLGSETVRYEGAEVSPFFFVSHGADASHGETADGRIVVAEKAGARCHHLFVGMPPLPWKVLQHFAHKAGVHLYSEAGDVVFANESYLAISAAESGKRTIRLPAKAIWQELHLTDNPKDVPRDAVANTAFDVDFEPHTCRMFQRTP